MVFTTIMEGANLSSRGLLKHFMSKLGHYPYLEARLTPKILHKYIA